MELWWSVYTRIFTLSAISFETLQLRLAIGHCCFVIRPFIRSNINETISVTTLVMSLFFISSPVYQYMRLDYNKNWWHNLRRSINYNFLINYNETTISAYTKLKTGFETGFIWSLPFKELIYIVFQIILKPILFFEHFVYPLIPPYALRLIYAKCTT